MKTNLHSLFVVLALIGAAHQVAAQGTGFTYQGRLNNSTNPVTGLYDLRFHLYDSSSGGTLLGGPTTNAAVPVTNGLFTVIMDFGAGAFTGGSNWLQIGVRTNGGAAFTALSPRQQVTPTPYAIFAEGANAAGLSGTIPAGDLTGVSGSGLTGVALLAGGNSFSGNQLINGMLSISDGSGSGYFTDLIIGPGGYTSGEKHSINFDDSLGHLGSLIVGYNGTYGYFSVGNLYDGTHESGTTEFMVRGDGKVGIGTANGPQQYLSVHGGLNVDQANNNSGFINNGNTNGYGITFGSGSGEGIASQRTAVGGNQDGLDFYTSFTARLSIDNSGDVWIPSPSQTIIFPATGGANSPMMEMFASGTANADRMVIAHSPSYPSYGLQYQDVPDRFNFLSAGTAVMSVNLGNPRGVGIGVTNPASALEVASGDVRIDGHQLLLVPPTNGYYANDGLVFGDGGLPGINAYGTGPFLAGYYGGALGALAPNVIALSWDSGGDVSVSNNLSAGSLTVRGNYLVVNGGSPLYAYLGDDGFGSDVQLGSQRSGITAVALYNTTDGAYMHLYCSSITIEGGADLAEPFKMTSGNAEIPQGAVVVIDEQNPGHLKMSDQDYDTHVAGVVSGANGINPGIQMQQQGILEGGKNVSLTGRVYVQADTSNGAIKPGDLLTTSGTPGHAMKVTDHARAAGAILGKAMTGLSEGKGMVLVLVTLQ